MSRALVLLALLLPLALAYQFVVPAGSEQCFYESVEKDKPVAVIFQVIAGGFNDINVAIRGPDNVEIYHGEKETDGRLTFTANQAGAYQFCFGNQMSTVTPKTMMFEVTTTLGYEDLELPEGEAPQIPPDIATKEHIEPLHNAVRDLASRIQSIGSEQRYLKMREYAHRNTNENTNARVMWWGFAEVGILIGATAFQIWYLRRIFEQKRAV